MKKENQILIAGFGGQGVLSMGQFLAHSAMGLGKHVAWVPSYGAEMRGGTANCLVTISNEEIYSPLTENPLTAIVLNRPSLDKFENRVQSDGWLIVNSSMVDREPERQDINILKLPLNELAENIGNTRGANMILLGAYMQKSQIVNIEDVLSLFEVIYKGKAPEVIENNRKAFLAGVEWAKKNW